MARTETDPGELLDLAVAAAREAGALVARMRDEGVRVAATKSSDVDVVTAADEASERLIRERLLGSRPDDGFLGEEGDDLAGTSGVRWVVDPIDGTVNYLYGLGEYAVSVAAQVEGESVAGIVYDVTRDVAYTAVRGGGSFRDGERLRVRHVAPMAERLIATGFGYAAETRARQGAAVAVLLPRVRDIRRQGSSALNLCQVGAGAVDGYVEEGPHPWDYAAGSLVATEAGARFELQPGRAAAPVVVCGPADGFEELSSLVRECGFTASA